MNLDTIFIRLLESGGLSGALIGGALLYLSIQVRGLKASVDDVRRTIGEKVFPKLDEHTQLINELKGRFDGRYEMWKEMRGADE